MMSVAERIAAVTPASPLSTGSSSIAAIVSSIRVLRRR
jgi:hypothetical protein